MGEPGHAVAQGEADFGRAIAAFERGESFLRLAALLAALLSGIAVALAAQRFAKRKTEEVALLKCLGASRGEIIAALTLEIALLALPACLIGLALGLGLQQVVIMLARDLLPSAAPSLPWAPPLAAFAIGLAVLFGFALPPLMRLRDVEPMRVFRQDVGMRPRRFDRSVEHALAEWERAQPLAAR